MSDQDDAFRESQEAAAKEDRRLERKRFEVVGPEEIEPRDAPKE